MIRRLVIDQDGYLRQLESLKNATVEFPLDILVEPHVEGRTTDQNRRLWWLHGLLAAHLNIKICALIRAKMIPSFVHFSAESVHEGIFKPKYVGTDPMTGRPKSSTRMSKQDFAAALTAYEADLATEGIEIPADPSYEQWESTP
jgi:hypothetical protein